MSRRRPARAGFTLVETLVALVVSSLVLVALTGLQSGLSGIEARIRRGAVAQEEVLSASRFLRTAFERSVPGGERFAAGGGPTALTLLTFGTPIQEAEAPFPLTLEARPDGERTTLVARWSDGAGGPSHEEVLLATSTALGWRYLAETGGRLAWSDLWQMPAEPPLAVALEVGYPELGPPLTLVFRTGARLPLACRTAPSLEECRRPG